MAENENLNSVSGEVENTDYIAAINELKQNSVDRAKYDQLRMENKRLLDSLVNGTPNEEVQKAEPKKSIEELRTAWNKPDQSNLEYIQNTLNLRNALIESGQPDPFLPVGKQIMPTNEDIEAANRVAKVFEECIEYADGDSSIFTNELMRRTVDTKIR